MSAAFEVPCIPEGPYLVTFERHRLTSRFGRGSLELWFKVAQFGDYFEMPLCRFYKVELDGKRSFRARMHGAFSREFVSVFAKQPPPGPQCLSWYRGIYIEADVRTVVRDHKQATLSECSRYSAISALLRKVDP